MIESENLDLVRSIYADWERGDHSSAEWADPEIEYVHVDGPDPGRWNGLGGMTEGFRVWLRAWEDVRIDADEYREPDDKHVLVLHHFTGRGKTSGMELAQMQAAGAWLFHIRGGKVTRMVHYFDRDRAFADLGLKE